MLLEKERERNKQKGMWEKERRGEERREEEREKRKKERKKWGR